MSLPVPEAKKWPVIYGNPVLGSTLTVSIGTWVSSGNLTANPNTGYSYQWQRGVAGVWSSISGATSKTYVVAAADLSFQLRCVVSAINAGGSTSQASLPVSVLDAFVRRSGQTLSLSGSRYVMLGFNLWRANVTSWNLPNNTGYLLNDGNTLDTTLKNIKASGSNCNAIRAWFMQQFALHNGANTGVYDWSAFDKTIQVARNNGFKIIATLQDQWSWETDSTATGPGWLPYTWYQSGYSSGPFTSYEHYSYRQWVTDVITRYANEPTIVAWELVNEAEVGTADAVPYISESVSAGIFQTFVADMASLVKSIDPNHLLSLGVSGNGMVGTLTDDYQTAHADSHVDLLSFHDYSGTLDSQGGTNSSNGLSVRLNQGAALNKPVYIGECGIHANRAPCNGNLSTVNPGRGYYLNQKMAWAFAQNGCVGYIPWQYDDRGITTDDYVYGPGDPGIGVVSSYAP